MTKKLLLFIALLCAFAHGAWAQNSWDEVYAMTQTTSTDWTALAGSTTGQTLGSVGNTTYYYANSNLSFTNSNAGGSGLTIRGTVYLYIPSGTTLTCTGANASGTTGGGAGIELTEGNTLYVVGSGTLNATGGNAANGGNGGNGGDAECTYNVSILGGSGGNGGNGGGGAGAGIGTRGANGGNGGAGGQRNGSYGQETTQYGVDGNAGSAGSTAGAMGNLYVDTSSVNLSAMGGSAGSSGTGGNRGLTASQHPGSNLYMASGGGGGGAGGFGGGASNIGTGGPGGGGGGGGAAGNVAWVVYSGTANGYYHAGAKGGKGGTNSNGTPAPDGTSIELTNPKYADIQAGGLRPNASDYDDDAGWEDGNAWHDGGAGGGCGYISLALWPFLGAGSEDNPYLINSADDWTSFAHNVSNGNSYSGQYVKLTNDISVTTMAGGYQDDDNYQPFSGTFDGDGHTLTLNVNNQSRFAAPFKCVSGATIKNLRTAGTIDGTGNADGKLLAGIIGVSFGNTTITGCRSSVTLTTDFGEDAALAGLVAGTKGGSLTIEGCVFDGSMTGASNTRCAGIAGYEYTATTTTISDCLFIPATLTISTADDSYTKTFSRDPDATITGCYYTQTLGAAQGTACYFGAATVPNTFGDMVTDYGVVKAYANGLFFNGKYYYSDAGSEENPYIIDSEDALARIAPIVNSGVSNFVGKHFSLICDLDLSGRNWTPIGNTVDTSFKGNFDGNNHTISNLTVNNPSGDYNGLFGYVEGVILEPGGNDPGCDYIRNFIVKNANVRGRDYTGGVAGHVLGKLKFENVILDGATVEGADYTSGFIGFAEGIQIWLASMDAYSPLDVQNCLFINGSVTANNAAHIYSSFDHPRSSFVMFGEISNHSFFTNCYFNNVVYNGAAAQEDYYNVQAYPVIVNAPSNINCEFLFAPIYVPGQAVPDNYVSAAGIDYNENYYIPGTTPFRLSYNDYQYRVTSVKINGVEVGTNIGEYVLNAGGSPIDSYTVTVEYEPGFTGSGTEDDPYLITSTELWDWFAISVNNGAHYSGKYVKLTNDISVSIPAGDRVSDSDNKPFSGTFLGDGHTITVTLDDDGIQGLALFRYINGATIKDLKVAGTIASSQNHSSGIVGFANGTNTIEDCLVTATLNIGSDYAGGIVGHGLSSNTTIRGCAFAGTINGVDGDRNNIGGIWGWSTSGTPTLLDCLENGTYTNIASMHPMGLQGGSGTITNCYYVTPQIGEPSNACTVNGSKHAYTFATTPANLGDAGTDYGMVKAYANGIFFDGKYYVPSTGNISRTVEGYGYETGKWAFIASPVEESIAPSIVTNLLGTKISDDPVLYDHDLYRLNPTSVMWENYNNQEHQAGFNLINGQGYLYATKETKTLVFSGTFNTENSKTVGLSDGFNLVGNPFVVDAYVSKPFYQMNAEGTEIVPIDSYDTYSPITIPPCYGVVVSATGTDEVTFSTEMTTQQSTNNGNLQMTLTRADVRSDAFQDKAIVSFNEGSQLEKFIFNENHAKLYIPQDGNDYAIAFSEMNGEIPLNFKTNETGRYTIGFNFENVKGVRIQLIDKLEDKIIDLNKDAAGHVSTYTFMGSTIDRSDRFTLVFTQVETNGIFAYQSGNDIIVSGDGTLEVFDVMGRMVMTQHINGVQTVEKPEQTGVYIFRLNGKSQKIVVK